MTVLSCGAMRWGAVRVVPETAPGEWGSAGAATTRRIRITSSSSIPGRLEGHGCAPARPERALPDQVQRLRRPVHPLHVPLPPAPPRGRGAHGPVRRRAAGPDPPAAAGAPAPGLIRPGRQALAAVRGWTGSGGGNAGVGNDIWFPASAGTAWRRLEEAT